MSSRDGGGGNTLDTTGGDDRAVPAAAPDVGLDTTEVAPVVRIGRYVLGDRIGAGGMGAVFRAYDPDLDRKIAIKLVKTEVLGSVGQRGSARLLREAQALARLAHPNVVAVYDVGVVDEQVFIAMELVDGRTLGAWARERPRGWREVVDVYLQAGRALAAAHALGIVHRDFKPDNAMIDRDGDAPRVRVLDFGLARALEVQDGERDAGDSSSSSSPSRDGFPTALPVDLTRTGGVVGTPRYMAPEQRLGKADARSDQFAFGVAMYEALYGELPYAGGNRQEIFAAVEAGRIREAPKGARVPAWLREAVCTALRPDPAARFPSMAAMLARIGRAPAWRRRVAVAIAGAVVVGAGATAAIALASTTDRTAVPPSPAAASPSPAPVVALENPRALTQLGGCAFSPVFSDASTIVFDETSATRDQLYAVPIAGGEATRLVDGPNADWRASPGPHPGQVTFVRTDAKEGTNTLWQLDVATRRVAALGIASGFPTYAGDDLIYAGFDRRQLRRHTATTDVAAAVTPGTSKVIALIGSPTGQVATIVRTNEAFPQLCTLADGALACTVPSDLLVGRPAFGPSGQLYYASRRGIVRAGRPEVVLGDAQAPGGIAIAPDGAQVVYSTCRSFTRVLDITDGKPREVLGDPDIDIVAAKADGSIAFDRRHEELVVSDHGKQHQVIDHAYGDVVRFDFEGDGNRMIVSIAGPKGGLFIADGSNLPDRVTSNPSDDNATFIAKGRLAFERQVEGHSRIMFIDADGSHETPGPDNRRLYGSDGHGHLLVLLTHDQQMFWYDIASGKQERIRSPILEGKLYLSQAQPLPDRAGVVVQIGANHELIWKIPTHGDPVLLYHAPDGETTSWVSVSPTGQILLPTRRWEGELFAARATTKL